VALLLLGDGVCETEASAANSLVRVPGAGGPRGRAPAGTASRMWPPAITHSGWGLNAARARQSPDSTAARLCVCRTPGSLATRRCRGLAVPSADGD